MALSRTSPNNFSKLKLDDLIIIFGLKNLPHLEFEELRIENNLFEVAKVLSQNIVLEIDYWNEQELVMKFISPLLNLMKICGQNFNTFAERKMTAIVDNIKLTGDVDFVVARGIREPREPYFFIQEYRRQKQGPDSDPFAQLLGEMLVAQVLNNEKMVYGCYIIGKYWTFVILESRNYCQLSSLDCTNLEDLEVIMSKLNWVKKYVEEKLK